MTSKLNRHAYQQLVNEDVAWLEKQPRTLEREHVIHIVKDSVRCYYGPAPDSVSDAVQMLAACERDGQRMAAEERPSEPEPLDSLEQEDAKLLGLDEDEYRRIQWRTAVPRTNDALKPGDKVTYKGSEHTVLSYPRTDEAKSEPDHRGSEEIRRLGKMLVARLGLEHDPLALEVTIIPRLVDAYAKGVEIGAEYAQRPETAWRVLINDHGEPYAIDNGTSRLAVEAVPRSEVSDEKCTGCGAPPFCPCTEDCPANPMTPETGSTPRG